MSGGSRAGRTSSTPDKYGYDEHVNRVDALLDELSKTRAMLNACNEVDQIGTDAANAALELCVKNNVELAAKILTMNRFIEACKQTGYRPEAWELALVMQTPQSGESLK